MIQVGDARDAQADGRGLSKLEMEESRDESRPPGIGIFVLRDNGSRGDIFLALAVVGPSRLVDGLNPEEDHPAAEVLTCVV
ncbi:hypothetical protein PRIPAC_95276 [Pristionchus pacificus]|uniref:Uncharacterized protein n=1 Tax=Pristionchus pacificus TaxID=54126 RepID=A0A2A6D1C9_PRIPA|nr:hypothetical protein PRIPAC_95276 [Pristionchus pacificus]|eukprot:PDM84302.1 hypothetical protein PRIPAC_33325 [Pristionchus pacificus]